MIRMSMKSTILIATIVALAVPASGLGGSPAPVKLAAKMNARAVVPTKPVGDVANAAGTFTGTLTQKDGRWKLSWKIVYSRLARPKIVIADIHYGRFRHFGPILVRLCGPCRSGQQGTKPVTAAAARALKTGGSFVTLITNRNPNGEIRGQILARTT